MPGAPYREGMTEERGRGSSPKGVAKRDEILQSALEVIAREGYRRASVKELADAVGLSQAGLLHYFDSKEELFVEILRAADNAAFARYGPVPDDVGIDGLREGYLSVIAENSQVPGLVALFTHTAVEAAEPEHPGHDFFRIRGAWIRDGLGGALARLQREGVVTDAVEPDVLARILQAVSDGLQVQWMQEPEIDMAAIVGGLFDALTPSRRES